MQEILTPEVVAGSSSLAQGLLKNVVGAFRYHKAANSSSRYHHQLLSLCNFETTTRDEICSVFSEDLDVEPGQEVRYREGQEAHWRRAMCEGVAKDSTGRCCPTTSALSRQRRPSPSPCTGVGTEKSVGASRRRCGRQTQAGLSIDGR